MSTRGARAAALVAVAGTLAAGKLVTIDNTAPRLTNTGIILDGHDGAIQKFDKAGPYWLHALSYGLCTEPEGQGCNQKEDRCGFRFDHNISIYTSTDLSSGSWQFVGYALNYTDRPEGTVFRPDVVHNPNTGKYVMWWNWVAANGTYMGYAGALSDSPAGPFTVVHDVMPLTHANSTYHAGDFHFFVDDDGTGYVIYSANFYMWIDELTPDFLGTTGRFAGPVGDAYFVEAPAIFKRGSTYYALFGHCCCFCYQGSGVLVYTAPHPLGPWTLQGQDKACVPPQPEEASEDAGRRLLQLPFLKATKPPGGAARITPEPTPDQGCLYNGSNFVSTVRSQQSYIATVDTPAGPQLLWIGDRWQQAPDGIKGHEPQYWHPLEFDADGTLRDIRWLDNFTIDVV